MCNIGGRFAVQQMPPGVTVTCRTWLWRVSHVEPATTGVVAVSVQPATPGGPVVTAFLSPFDQISINARTARWRAATRHRLRHVAAALDGAWPEMPLASLVGAATVPWPHQLVPALAMLRGRGLRVFLADDVGLGKTVAAGLLIAELAARDLASRVLVLTPAGLRDQWQSELRRHLAIATTIVDAGALADLTHQVPAGCSPWIGGGVLILSLDFAKQPAVLRSLAQETWDAIVIDEAHTVSGDSQRAAAVRALAVQSRAVLLITATPHNGFHPSFRKLISVGGHSEDPLIWIRRGRAELGLWHRRTSRKWVLPQTAGEVHLHRALQAYAARVDRAKRPEARLAMIVLKKRALSSPDALLCTLQRRLAWLSETHEPIGTTGLLRFDAGESDDEDDTPSAALSVRGLNDVGDELAVLRTLIELADRARQSPIKYRTLERVVTRTAESAILFTEYRDTLRIVASRLSSLTTVATLHGGLDREARRDAIRRFTSGQARILVATDAAAEGLNLQARCRFVVHIDLPWSPTTLAQRVGRVDRIGQARLVREWQLTSGHEEVVVAALARRFQRIQRDLGGTVSHDWSSVSPVVDAGADDDRWRVDANDLGERAAMIASAAGKVRGLRERCFATAPQHRGPSALQDAAPRGIPWIRSRRATPVVGRGVVLLFTAFPRRRGDARTHIAVHVALARVPDDAPKTWLPWIADQAVRVAMRSVDDADLLRARAAARERDLLKRSESEHRRLHGRWQPSLFDERAARVIDVAREGIDRRTSAHARRLDELSDAAGEQLFEPLLALIAE